MNAEEVYDAAEMCDGKGFSDEGHRAGLAAVVAAAKAEQREVDAQIAHDEIEIWDEKNTHPRIAARAIEVAIRKAVHS